MQNSAPKQSWLNRTVLGVGLTSLFSDWSHETATAVLPAFLAAIGAGPAWLGAIEGIAHLFRKVFLWPLLPGMIAVAAFWLLVRERPMEARAQLSFLIGLKALPPTFRRLLLGVGVFGAGDFSHSLLILFATRALTPAHGLA